MTATEPAGLRELRAAVAEGRFSPVIPVRPVMPLWESPLAAVTDPGHVSGELTVEIRIRSQATNAA